VFKKLPELIDHTFEKVTEAIFAVNYSKFEHILPLRMALSEALPVRWIPSSVRFSVSDSDSTDSISVRFVPTSRAPGDLPPDSDGSSPASDPPAPPTSSPSVLPFRLLDRYLNPGGAVLSSRIFTRPADQIVHYMIHRRHTRKKGLKRKLFQLTNAMTSDVIAAAEFASLTSSTLEVTNHRGLVCEIDVKAAKGPFVMRVGMEAVLVISVEAGGAICAEFRDCDGTEPPYPLLHSPAKSCHDVAQAFGSRPAVPSVKNCKLCSPAGEVVTVRKVRKKALAVDARSNVSFLSCFAIGLVMFLLKP
jgi:hypothetical protein